MLPRQVLPRQFYLVTRRCTQRQFPLRPDPATNNAFTYALIEAAQRAQIDVLLPCAMSNHYHAVIFDRFGRYPEFVEHFHKMFARSQNALRGRWESSRRVAADSTGLWRPARRHIAGAMASLRARTGWVIGLAVAVAACAHNVAQDAASGRDREPEGAPLLRIETAGQVTGIVTYPGGDRVDWKRIELPRAQRGTLALQLRWTAPRPGLQLAFEVFDASNRQVATSVAPATPGAIRSVTLDDAHGSYAVRIYAVGRGDAGRYRLSAAFHGKVVGPRFDPSALEVPGPPRLAAVPAPAAPAPASACELGCPAGWTTEACHEACGPRYDFDVVPCSPDGVCRPPPPPPPRAVPHVSLCPADPECDPITIVIVDRIIAATPVGASEVIIVPRGRTHGVAASWTGTVLRGDTDEPFPGGEVTVLRVDRILTVGKVFLTAEQLEANPRVRLHAP